MIFSGTGEFNPTDISSTHIEEIPCATTAFEWSDVYKFSTILDSGIACQKAPSNERLL